MSRTATITKDMLLDAAFELMKAEGIEEVTARKLATKAGCSTQPIFRIYQNMDEVCNDAFVKALAYYEEFYKAYPKNNNVPFVNLGMAYIEFAQKEKMLFKGLFLSEKRYGKSLYEMLSGSGGYVSAEIAKAKASGCTNAENMFMKMWIFIHGAACMSLTGDYDLTGADTTHMLENAYKSFLG